MKPEKRGFWPMRKKLGEKFGVVFSFAVVVMDTEDDSFGGNFFFFKSYGVVLWDNPAHAAN